LSKDHLERSPKLYLVEILEFIEKADEYTQDMSYEDFAKDSRTVDAVNSNIRNIGEAVRVLAKHRSIKDLFYRFHVPYRELSDMRSDLTHEYFTVNIKSIWQTAQTVIALKPQFKKVLDQISNR
jgi:uncharacterized protein with HEPN domain